MKISIRNQSFLSIGYYATCIALVFKVCSCSSLPLSDDYGADDQLGTIDLKYLMNRNVVDLPSTKVETFDYQDYQNQKPPPHKRHSRLPTEVSCCPSVKEIVEPLAGKNRAGEMVELYQEEGAKQRFYETSCAPSVANHRCNYLDKKHKENSRCEQQYSYSYALVRNSENDGLRMDYIQLRSGCSCRIHVP